MTTQLLPTDLQRFIQAEVIQGELIDQIGDTPTVPAAAAALGVEPDRIVKTLLFEIKAAGTPGQAPDLGQTDANPADRVSAIEATVVVISCGENRVDRKLLARHFDVGQKRVRLAAPETVLESLGYPAGGVPPFGHRTQFPVLLDAKITSLAEGQAGIIYGGGGDERTMLKLTVQELLRVTNPTIIRLS